MKVRARNTAFTLIELLVVIGIIATLLGILAPSVHKAMKQGGKVRAMNYVKLLSDAATLHKNDTGYYPGQRNPGQLDPNNTPFGGKGSLLLARTVWTPKGSTEYPRSSWCEYKEEMLLPASDPNVPISEWAISDGIAKGKAILYYPSRIGKEGTPAQFEYKDNNFYTTGAGEEDTVFNFWKAGLDAAGNDYKPGNDRIKRNNGEFLIISAGLDGIYFTKDDITNP